MFSDGSLRTPDRVVPKDFVGRYAFYDDGWPGKLILSLEPGGGLHATYHSYRYHSDYEAACSLDDQLPYKVTITIQEFNELGRQIFSGYLFTRSKHAIAGSTNWKGVPYGFFARKARPSLFGPPRPGKVDPADFVGRFNFYCEGEAAVLTLRRHGTREFQGALLEHNGTSLPVSAVVDAQVSHHITATVHSAEGDAGAAPLISGFLFSWSRDAMAGFVEWGGIHLACYATKLSPG